MSLFNNFIKNTAYPSTTFWGRLMLAGMNHGHQKMALWCIENHIKLSGNGKFVVCNESSKMEGNERWTNILDMNIYTVEEIVDTMQQAGFADIKSYKKENTQQICVIGKK